MKELSEIKVNAAKLKLIIGENINFKFPKEGYYTKLNVKKYRDIPVSLAYVIKESDYAKKRSHDERFDNKHPVDLAIASIKESGLSKAIVAAIRNDFKNQKTRKIGGKWAILNDIITDDHRSHIIDLLSKTAEYKISQFGEEYYIKNK